MFSKGELWLAFFFLALFSTFIGLIAYTGERREVREQAFRMERLKRVCPVGVDH